MKTKNFIHDEEEQVCLIAHDLATGVAEKMTAHYLVGCDGANSFVRQSLLQGIEDLGFQQKWLVIDVILKSEACQCNPKTDKNCKCS